MQPKMTLLLLAVPAALLAQGGFNGPGAYEIRNLQSGKVLDLDRNDQTTVLQYSATNANNQTWIFSQADPGYYFVRNNMNGNALDAPSNNNSSPVRGNQFTGSPTQMWKVDAARDGNAMILTRQGKSLDIPDGSNRDGLRVQIYDANGDPNQRFVFRQVQGVYNQYGNQTYGNQTGTVNQPVPAQAMRITCASDSGTRVYCGANTTGSVQMTRQISGSPCIQGQTWGYDQQGVWVDRGCRAEFQVTPSGAAGSTGTYVPRSQDPRYGGRGGVFRGAMATVLCSSESGGRVHCDANTSSGAQLMRTVAGNCVQNQTWGFDSTGVWVTQFCRGEFQVGQ